MKKLLDINGVRTNKLSDKILSQSLIVRKFLILMYGKYIKYLPALKDYQACQAAFQGLNCLTLTI